MGVYTKNINMDYTLKVMEQWLDLHNHELPTNFPHKKITFGLDLIMRNNVFTFGNWYYLQKKGTTMGSRPHVQHDVCTQPYTSTHQLPQRNKTTPNEWHSM